MELIVEMAEFQDGSAFIWRSQQIFEEIRSDVATSGKVNDIYAEIWEAYEQRDSPAQVTLLVDEAIAEFEIVSGTESEESSHMEEVFGEEPSIVVNLEESLDLASDEPEKTDLAPLAPSKQIKEGVEPENIQCKESLELIFKSSGEPACVKETSVQKLISWGWTQ